MPGITMSTWEKLKALRKSSTDYIVGGVCGGLGAATPVPTWMWRAAFLFCALAFGVGFLLYAVLWICVPEDQPTGPAASGQK